MEDFSAGFIKEKKNLQSMEKYYLDTSIWLDYYEERGKNGEIAEKLIANALLRMNKIAFSDLHIMELKHLGYSGESMRDMIRIVKQSNLLLRIHISKEQLDEMRRLAKARSVPKGDALHAILCRDNECQLIANDKDFDKLKDVTEPKKPEEIS